MTTLDCPGFDPHAAAQPRIPTDVSLERLVVSAVEALWWLRLVCVSLVASLVVLTTTFVWGARAKTQNDSAVAWGTLQIAAWAQAHMPKP